MDRSKNKQSFLKKEMSSKMISRKAGVVFLLYYSESLFIKS